MTYRMSFSSLNRRAAHFLFLLTIWWVTAAHAEPLDFSGSWYREPIGNWTYRLQPDLRDSGLEPAPKVELTGGHFWFQSDFELAAPGRYVLDFKNTSILGHFRHFIFNDKQQLVAVAEGGIQSQIDDPFFLRHGREFELTPGHYRLVTEITGPFFLAQPEPYLDTLEHYQQAIKPANALALIGLGVFIGLGIYYTALALVRRRVAEGMYALFILGNLLFNGSALLVFTQLLGMHWIYMVSLPILFSNCAYILFVMALLEIRPESHPRLYRAGQVLLGLLVGLIMLALIKPNWSLELDRYGVGVFLTYGLTAGISRARQGSISARLYLVAIGVFFVLGGVAISQARLNGVYTLYIEHVGLIAVAVEVILLALVLSYQFAQLHRERESALQRLEQSNRIAQTDALTGLANRYALDIELDRSPAQASMTFLDLDGLKYYNDRFGHARGDDLLRSFAQHLAACLADKGRLFRIGGDEFAITCASGDIAWVDAMLEDAIQCMRASGFEFAGASAGSVYCHEASNKSELKHLADQRMYQNKRRRKLREGEPQVAG